MASEYCDGKRSPTPARAGSTRHGISVVPPFAAGLQRETEIRRDGAVAQVFPEFRPKFLRLWTPSIADQVYAIATNQVRILRTCDQKATTRTDLISACRRVPEHYDPFRDRHRPGDGFFGGPADNGWPVPVTRFPLVFVKPTTAHLEGGTRSTDSLARSPPSTTRTAP